MIIKPFNKRILLEQVRLEEKENDIVMIFGAIEDLRADPRSELFDGG